MKRNHLAVERKHCRFCRGAEEFDPNHIDRLRDELDHDGRQRPAIQSGNCPKHQAVIAKAIKQARKTGLLPELEPATSNRIKHRPWSRKIALDDD